MTKKLRFVWIDDEQKKEPSASTLEKNLDIKVEFRKVETELLSFLSDIVEDPEPDLIIMDHILTHAKGAFVGSTASEYLRQKWPECPIVCVTAEPKEVDVHKRELYELVIDYARVSEYYSTLFAIAKSYQKLREKRPKDTAELLTYLKAPKDDRQRLKAVIPDEIKMSYEDKKGSLFLISKWVRDTLLKRPGFLYDRLWTATLLGLREESFQKVEHHFPKAKYSGIFEDDGQKRWWQSRLRAILSSLIQSDHILLPWEMGQRLPGITPDDYSKCHRSGEEFPETVAYIDESTTMRAPMRLRYTVHHPRFEDVLFFEEMRMMKARE